MNKGKKRIAEGTINLSPSFIKTLNLWELVEIPYPNQDQKGKGFPSLVTINLDDDDDDDKDRNGSHIRVDTYGDPYKSTKTLSLWKKNFDADLYGKSLQI